MQHPVQMSSDQAFVVDNTLWGGSVVIPTEALEAAEDAAAAQDVMAIQALNAKIGNDSRVARVNFLTIADGVTICRVR